MSELDIEGVLAAAITDYLGNYTLPANYARPYVAHETHRDVAKRCGPLIAAHVAAVLREQIAAWLRDFPWTETARDDLLAALVAPSRVPREET